MLGVVFPPNGGIVDDASNGKFIISFTMVEEGVHA